MLGPKLHKEFELYTGSYSILFWIYHVKHEKAIDIYLNRYTSNKRKTLLHLKWNQNILFNFWQEKLRYYLEALTKR